MKAPSPRPQQAEVPFWLNDAAKLPPPPRSSAGLVVLAGVFCVLLAAGGGAAWLFLVKPKDTPPTEMPVVVQTPQPPDDAPTPAVPQAGAPARSRRPQLPRHVSPQSAALSGEQVYQQLLRSTVFILSGEKDSAGRLFLGAGSGALVNKSHRLVITNYHVVGNNDRVFVFFPERDAQGELRTHPDHYATNMERLGIKARVVARETGRDLALLELERVPQEAVTLPLSARPANPGSQVFSVGASGINLRDFSGALWRLSTGTVRGRYRDALRFENGQSVNAMFLETQKPVNPGDSGGPTVNDRGELVAVVSSGDPRKDLVKHDIDLTEVRDYLKAYAARSGWVWADAPTQTRPLAPGDPAVLDALAAVLKDGEPGDRVLAARRLADLGDAARNLVPTLLLGIDGADTELSDAIGVALARIGPPPHGSDAVLIRALASKSPVARAYAVQTLSQFPELSGDALEPLLNLHNDSSAAIRAGVFRALAVAGTAARDRALSPAIEHLADADEDVRQAASALLAKYQPFTPGDWPLLEKHRTHARAEVRSAVVGWLAPLVREANGAVQMFRPLLRDSAPAVRAAALRGLLRMPETLPLCQREISECFEDADPSVATLALSAAPFLKDRPGVVDRMARVYKSAGNPALRGAAAAALVQTLNARIDHIPLMRDLYRDGNTQARLVCLERFRVLSEMTRAVDTDLLEALKDSTEAVRVAAFQAIAHSDVVSDKAVSLAAAVFDRDHESDAVRIAALGVLRNGGQNGFHTLQDLTGQDLSVDLIRELCQSFATLGARSHAVEPWLLRMAEQDAECRNVLAPWLIQHATRETVFSLLRFTDFYKPSRPGDKVVPHALELRKWAVTVLGDLNYQDLPSEAVESRLRTLTGRKNEDAVHAAAEAALRKLQRRK